MAAASSDSFAAESLCKAVLHMDAWLCTKGSGRESVLPFPEQQQTSNVTCLGLGKDFVQQHAGPLELSTVPSK